MRISGTTSLIAHIGWPTHSFKAPLIYNPYFEQAGIDAVVVPMGCKPEHFGTFLPALFTLENITGALITMPHKMAVVELLDEVSPAVKIAGSCNAVRRDAEGHLVGDLFDGEGFVRGLVRKGVVLAGAKVLVVGAGGVGCSIAASLAGAGVGTIGLYDARPAAADALAVRLRAQLPALSVQTGSNDPAGWDVVVNATPLGMHAGDPLPIDMDRLSPDTFVGEVVMRQETTAFLAAAQERGCRVQVGTDMLFEQIPAYLEFFGLPGSTAAALRAVATIVY